MWAIELPAIPAPTGVWAPESTTKSLDTATTRPCPGGRTKSREDQNMGVAGHPRPAELEGVGIAEITDRYVARFSEREPDWEAFEDAKIEGYKRAQHRFIGAGGSGKHDDLSVMPACAHTLSIMYVEPGQGDAAHTHEVEEEGREPSDHPSWPVGLHQLSAGGDSRLPQQQPRAGVVSGDAGTRAPGNHGLCRFRPVLPARRPSPRSVSGARDAAVAAARHHGRNPGLTIAAEAPRAVP